MKMNRQIAKLMKHLGAAALIAQFLVAGEAFFEQPRSLYEIIREQLCL